MARRRVSVALRAIANSKPGVSVALRPTPEGKPADQIPTKSYKLLTAEISADGVNWRFCALVGGISQSQRRLPSAEFHPTGVFSRGNSGYSMAKGGIARPPTLVGGIAVGGSTRPKLCPQNFLPTDILGIRIERHSALGCRLL